MILVVGGTGDLGSCVTKRLLAKGESVRVMTRTPSKAAGVQQFIYLSTPDATPDNRVPFLEFKYAVEQYLRGSGLSFVIFRAAAFMESHAHMLIGQPILAKGKVSLFGKGDNPRNFVAADDVARFVLIGLEDPQAAGQTIQVGGPENWTNLQVVGLYEKVTGRQVKVSHAPLGMLKMMSGLIRPFHPGLSQIMKSSILFDTTDQTIDMSKTLQQYPMTLTKLEDWVRDRVAREGVPAVGVA